MRAGAPRRVRGRYRRGVEVRLVRLVVAWFGGPPGSGKSTLALRAAQYGFLSADCEPDPSGKDWLAQLVTPKATK